MYFTNFIFDVLKIDEISFLIDFILFLNFYIKTIFTVINFKSQSILYDFQKIIF